MHSKIQVFSLLAFVLIITNCFGQGNRPTIYTLHAYIFSNTDDLKIGSTCLKDYCNIVSEIQKIAKGAHYKLDLRSFIGSDFNSEKFDTLFKTEKFNINDIGIIYISSHGFRTSSDTTKFPNILMPGAGKEFINAKSINDKFIEKLQPSLLLTIIDACNNNVSIPATEIRRFKGYLAKGAYKAVTSTNKKMFASESDSIPLIITGAEASRYKELFRGVYGNIIVTSSQPGKKSEIDITGSTFTNALIKSLNDAPLFYNYAEQTWESILSAARTIIERKHVPVWNQQITLRRPWYVKLDPEAPIIKFYCSTKQINLPTPTRVMIDSLEINLSLKQDGWLWPVLPEVESVIYTIYPMSNNVYSGKTIILKSNRLDNNFGISTKVKGTTCSASAHVKYKWGSEEDLTIMY